MHPNPFSSKLRTSPVSPWISVALYTLVALIWLISDRRVEDAIRQV
jgi:hypothetical protein